MLEAAGEDNEYQIYYKCHSSFSRPIVVTFEEFKDRDEVLRKAGLVKGGQVHVTEDMSRKVSHHHHHYHVIIITIIIIIITIIIMIINMSGQGEQTGAEKIHARCSEVKPSLCLQVAYGQDGQISLFLIFLIIYS